MPDLKNNHQALVSARTELPAVCKAFLENTASDNFLPALATFLCKEVGVNYVLIGYPEQDNFNTIRTAALVVKEKLVDNITYSLAGTPCENVMGRNCCYF